MAHLSEIYLKKETLQTILTTMEKKGMAGISFTISTNDEAKEFSRQDGSKSYQNVSAFVSQTKEQREAKTAKFYVGNGSVKWSDGKAPLVPGGQAATQALQAAKPITQEEDPF